MLDFILAAFKFLQYNTCNGTNLFSFRPSNQFIFVKSGFHFLIDVDFIEDVRRGFTFTFNFSYSETFFYVTISFVPVARIVIYRYGALLLLKA